MTLPAQSTTRARPAPAASDLPIVPASTARRLLMRAQGLLHDPQRPATPASVYRLIEQMGFVQIDTISIVERAHHHILHSRFDAYTPAILARLHHKERKLFEHMTHDASLIPARWFPHWRPRFERSARSAWWRTRLGPDMDAKVTQVLDHITRHGASMARHFLAGDARPSGPWWDWRPEKTALEYLWRRGVLSVSARDNFHKVYDLTERVYPAPHALPAPSDAEHTDWACSTAIERLGVATPGEIAAFWRSITPAAAAVWCRSAAQSGRIVPVLAASSGQAPPRKAFAVPDWKRAAARAPDPPARARLLSPFDPVIRDRARLLRLFAFDYRFEAFVPAPKRAYGYYVLPILEGDRLIGRLDPKLHRDRAELKILKLWWEPAVEITPARRAALEDAVERYARFIGADRWTLPRRARR